MDGRGNNGNQVDHPIQPIKIALTAGDTGLEWTAKRGYSAIIELTVIELLDKIINNGCDNRPR